MKWMNWLKLKSAAGTVGALLLAGGAAVVAVSQTGGGDEWTALQIAQQAREAYAVLDNYSDCGTVLAESGGANTKTRFTLRLQRPGSCLIYWFQTTAGRYTSRGNIWSAGCEDFIVMATAGQHSTYRPQKTPCLQTALTMGAGASAQASATIPGIFFRMGVGDVLELPALGCYPLKKERDEKVGHVDCYVITSVTDPAKPPGQGACPDGGGKLESTRTLWIGKKDHLIHQARTTMTGASITETHDEIAVNQGNLSPYFVH